MTLKPQRRAHGEGQGCQCREYRMGARLVRFFILIFFQVQSHTLEAQRFGSRETQGFLPLVSGIGKPDTRGAMYPWGSPRRPMGLLAGGRGKRWWRWRLQRAHVPCAHLLPAKAEEHDLDHAELAPCLLLLGAPCVPAPGHADSLTWPRDGEQMGSCGPFL